MPSPSAHALVWLDEQQCYELRTNGRSTQCFRRGDEPAWLRWLDEHMAFAFIGQAGRLSVLKEARARGAGYWYAYRTQQRHTRKHYLGPAAKLTFDRLERTVTAFTTESSVGSPAQVAPSRVSPQQEASSASSTEADREGSRVIAQAQAEQDLALLSPKLSRPRLSTPLVERERLLGELDAVRSYPVTLVSASAGSGKTTLLSMWAAARFSPQESQRASGSAWRNESSPMLAWLSLDELDNDPIRFWTAVIAALRTCLPQRGRLALAMLQSSQSPPLTNLLSALLQDLGEEDADVILILDDYHVISVQAVADSMRFLLEHLAANLHVVLASRTDPELPLARWRARGYLLEIRDRDLRFTASEAARFLTKGMGLPISEEEAAILHRRTEGWIAGLQLAALASRKYENLAGFVKDFAGSHRFLLDYVRQEILAQLPATLQTFLLQTSILPRMNAALCQAVTASPSWQASQDMLEALERANLFVVPLDEERRWYRLHDLFREALLAALRTAQPETAPALHRRAATYYEAQGAWSEAITHRLAAADYSEAARLMEQTGERFMVHGQAATIAEWVLVLPEPLVRTHARLMLTAALYLLNTVTYAAGGQRAKTHAIVRQLMARVETALRSQSRRPEAADASPAPVPVDPALDQEDAAAEEARLHLRLRVLRVYLEFMDAAVHGQHERMSRMQPEIEEIQDALDHEEDAEAIWRLAPISWSFVLHYTVRQEGARLLPRLLDAKRRVVQWDSHFVNIKIRQYVACTALEAGRLRLAHEESQAALDLIEQIGGYALLKGYFELVQVDVLYEWNHLMEARGRLQTVLHDAATWQHLDLLGSGYFYLTQVELARGDRTAAQQALRALEDLVRREHFGTHPDALPAMQALWWLAQGQIADAAAWASGVVFPEGAWDVNLYDAFPIVIRVSFARQQWNEALDLLERWSGHLDRPANIRITLTFLAQLLVALQQTGQREKAREIATRLFALAEPEGYLRVYLDEGEPMRQALLGWRAPHRQDHTQTSSTTAYVARLLAAFKQEQERRLTPHISRDAESPMPIEPVSPQELKVLRLLVAGQTYAEIAEALVVSPNTIKTQVSSIYRKLGVSRRAEAIAVASRLRLL